MDSSRDGLEARVKNSYAKTYSQLAFAQCSLWGLLSRQHTYYHLQLVRPDCIPTESQPILWLGCDQADSLSQTSALRDMAHDSA